MWRTEANSRQSMFRREEDGTYERHRGDMFSDQKIMPKHNTSQEKARTEKAPASSAEQSTELTVCPTLVVALNWYFCISLHFKGVWVNLMLV